MTTFVTAKNGMRTFGGSEDAFDIYNSTCFKGVAIIMMIIHHCFLSPKRYEGQNLIFLIPENLLNYIALFFKICVCIFVFISAYGITKKMMSLETLSDNGKVQVFIRNLISSRIVKLLGGFIFVILLVDLFGWFYDPGRFAKVYGMEFPDNIGYFLIDIFGLAEIFQTPTFLATFWYYSLAIVLIVITPLLYLLMKKIGCLPFLSLMTIINLLLKFENKNIWQFFLCICVGIICASENTITKIVNYKVYKNNIINDLIKLVFEVILLFVLMVFRESALKEPLCPIWNAIIPVVLGAFGCEFLFKIPVIKQVLSVLGKYSANIFLVHNFIRIVWFYDFTYSFKYPILIVTVLLLISLVLSILIELLKKVIGYNRFVGWLAKCVQTAE